MVVAEGTPEHVATVAESFTGQYLAPVLAQQDQKLTRQAS
jgi:excinuclease ABC subunit A